MIDLHCHLGIGVDDGVKTPEEAIALASSLYEAGVTHVACTSHLRRNRGWINDAGIQSALHQALDKHVGTIGLQRFNGAEHYLDEMLLETCRSSKSVPYGSSNWILLELPYEGEPPNLMQTLFSIRSAGYKILLAHLERYPYIYEFEDKIEALINAGYWVQANLGSFAGAYGPEYQNAAQYLLKQDYIHVLAGDCHQAIDVKEFIIDGFAAIHQLTTPRTLQKLTQDNPALILGL